MSYRRNQAWPTITKKRKAGNDRKWRNQKENVTPKTRLN